MQTGSERSDAGLLRAYAGGDVAALDELVGRHGPALLGFLKAMTRDTAVAEDLFQETWMRVIRKPGGFRDGSFRAWVWRIATNLRIDRLRRQKHGVILDVALAGGDDAVVPEAVDPAPGPAELLVSKDQVDAIAACVARLPDSQREVFLLRTQAGLSFAEIAKLLRVPLNTALGRMHYAVLRLRRELQAPENPIRTPVGRGAT
jgi:RNA polymerase sigma-70 factor (ECF subfamily)